MKVTLPDSKASRAGSSMYVTDARSAAPFSTPSTMNFSASRFSGLSSSAFVVLGEHAPADRRRQLEEVAGEALVGRAW
jgi:hypothetical protein